MGLIREPLDVDFYVDPRPLTKEERKKSVSTFGNTKQKWLNEKLEGLLPKRNFLLM